LKKPVSAYLIAILAVAMLGFLAFAQYQFAMNFPGGNDSTPRWVGTQSWLYNGLNPYSEEVTQRSQITIYGRLANLDDDQVLFVYPFYVIFFYIPVIWLPYELARAIWMVILEGCLVGIVILGRQTYKWHPPAWLFGLTLCWAILFYHGLRTVILWQLAGLVALFITSVIWALKNNHDYLAGVCLALATIKPQMVFLILPFITILSITTRRWKVIISMAVTLLGLAGISFFLMPSWLTDMWKQIISYPTYTKTSSPLLTLTTKLLPFLGSWFGWFLTFLLLGWLLWEWWRIFSHKDSHIDWVIALTLVITNLVVVRTATTNYVMMLPALFLLFSLWEKEYGKRSYYWAAAFELVYLAGTYWLFAVTVVARREHWSLYLPLPFLLLIGLILARKKAQGTQLVEKSG
jgi:hypothetical protein